MNLKLQMFFGKKKDLLQFLHSYKTNIVCGLLEQQNRCSANTMNLHIFVQHMFLTFLGIDFLTFSSAALNPKP